MSCALTAIHTAGIHHPAYLHKLASKTQHACMRTCSGADLDAVLFHFVLQSSDYSQRILWTGNRYHKLREPPKAVLQPGHALDYVVRPPKPLGLPAATSEKPLTQ